MRARASPFTTYVRTEAKHKASRHAAELPGGPAPNKNLQISFNSSSVNAITPYCVRIATRSRIGVHLRICRQASLSVGSEQQCTIKITKFITILQYFLIDYIVDVGYACKSANYYAIDHRQLQMLNIVGILFRVSKAFLTARHSTSIAFCSSVTRWYCAKTTHAITKFSLNDSDIFV